MNSEVTDETVIDVNLTEENLVFSTNEKCKSPESDLSNNHIIFHNNISPEIDCITQECNVAAEALLNVMGKTSF